MGGVVEVLEWTLQSFGPVSLVVIGFAGYNAWLYHHERKAHRQTQDKTFELQILQIEALNELKESLQTTAARKRR